MHGYDLDRCPRGRGRLPNRKHVVTWKDETTNVIDVVIERVDAPNQPGFEAGNASVIGKQAGSSGSAYACFGSAPEGTVAHLNP